MHEAHVGFLLRGGGFKEEGKVQGDVVSHTTLEYKDVLLGGTDQQSITHGDTAGWGLFTCSIQGEV